MLRDLSWFHLSACTFGKVEFNTKEALLVYPHLSCSIQFKDATPQSKEWFQVYPFGANKLLCLFLRLVGTRWVYLTGIICKQICFIHTKIVQSLYVILCEILVLFEGHLRSNHVQKATPLKLYILNIYYFKPRIMR